MQPDVRQGQGCGSDFRARADFQALFPEGSGFERRIEVSLADAEVIQGRAAVGERFTLVAEQLLPLLGRVLPAALGLEAASATWLVSRQEAGRRLRANLFQHLTRRLGLAQAQVQLASLQLGQRL